MARKKKPGQQVTIFEVGPRDGLQNEPRPASLELKLEFLRGLRQAGLSEIEAGAFVREDRVPQMKDSDAIFHALRTKAAFRGPRYWGLVPNLKGFERAVAAGATSIAVFTAATEPFNQRNIGMSIAESLAGIREILREARAVKMSTRAYLSTAFGCPFEGRTDPARTLRVALQLLELGVEQVSVGDTIGVATPREVDAVIPALIQKAGADRVAVHFHDTRGTALANTLRTLEYGVRTVDSSAGGLGGCPFAPGATGNLATEDLVYMLDGMGFETGVDLEALCRTSLALATGLGRPLSSRYLQAYAASCS